MKPLRILLAALALICVLLAGVVCLAFTPRVQTWAAHRILSSHPAWRAEVATVAVGPAEVDLTGVRVAERGALLILPSLRAELPVITAGLGHGVLVRRLTASGWTLDLSHAQLRGPGLAAGTSRRTGRQPPAYSLLPSAYADQPPAAAALEVFEGLFHRLRLPVDFQLDALDLQGDVILPPAPGSPPARVHLALSGGGLQAGGEGVFTYSIHAISPSAGSVSTVSGEGTLAAAMDTPRTFSRLAVKLDASATGGNIPAGAKLTANLVAARAPTGETYDLSLAGENKDLVDVQANLADATHALAGTWRLDVGDDDLAPFALGRPLPIFTAAGSGRFDTDATMARLHASGQLTATADELGVLRPGLEAVGAIKLAAAFDVAHRDGELRVDRLSVALSGLQPIATVKALQAFSFNVRTGELKVADPAADLLGIALQDVPAAWAQPFLHALVVTSGDLRGNLGVSARAGGLGLRSTAPLTVTGLSATRAGQPLLGGIDASLVLSADYAPQGWSLEIKPCTARRGDATLLTFEASLGQLAGANQPVKATGKIDADLAVLAQSISGPALSHGEFTSDFTAILGAQRGYQVRFKVSGLELATAPDAPPAPVAWPAVSGEIRADVAANGTCTLVAPVTFAVEDRNSDLTLAGTFVPDGPGWLVEGRLTSDLLYSDDLELVAGAFALGEAGAAAASPTAGAPPAAGAAPFWAGFAGRVALGLKRVRLAQSDWSGVQGTLHLAPATLDVENLQASLVTGGTLAVGGTLFFAAGPAPYAYKASLAVSDFDYGAYSRARHPDRAPPVEGKFKIAGQVTGTARDLASLARGDRVQGSFQLSSKGGLFRALQADVADSLKQSPALISQALDSVGSFFGLKADKTDEAKKLFDKQGKLVVALAERLREVPYDQIDVDAERGADLDVRCTEFALISPEVRVNGTGRITYEEGVAIADEPLTFDGAVGARGGLADALNGVGLLGDQRDDLGYTKMNQPFHLGGTLDDLDAKQWEETLIKSALHKATGGIFDKLLGK